MTSKGHEIELTKEDYIRYFKFKRGWLNFVEICFVFVVFSVVCGFGWLDSTINFILPSRGSDFNRMPVGIQVLFATSLDVAYTIIYGISPLQKIILKIFGYDDKQEEGRKGRVSLSVAVEDEKEAEEETFENYLKKLIKGSERLSNTILSRGSLYLFLGIVFSICGLSFFYMQAHTLNPEYDITRQIISLLPNFGVLFFIELISFFFLKQYRVTMDEFRYYEAIKRSREEMLTVIKLYLTIGKESDLSNVLEKINFSSQVGKLESGQSTELLESRKMDKNELDSLTRIIEAAIGKLGTGK
ncbi:hypothetical protein [Citrobacter portucalensis]|uniref:hypothetical protein n=1 Tax=Citrobacter portucalensis TaxID=1639133 RepID=UPI0022E30AA4|nr:hypothetical protein [Citrobacter portucalensis]